MVTIEFSKTPKVIVHDGSFPIPEARLEINYPSAKYQEIKGLVPLTLKIGKIMWIHPDLAQDKQWDLQKSKSKGKSCNVISVLPDDDNVTTTSLSDSEGKRYACTAQADVPQLTGTQSRKLYLKQYEKDTVETQQQTTSAPAPLPTLGKEKQKEIRFDHVLKNLQAQGLTCPFVLTY